MLRVYTSKRTGDTMNLVNVSWSGHNIFKPYGGYDDDALLVKQGKMHVEELFRKYRNHMRSSYEHNKDMWNWFLSQKLLIFGCNCHLDELCHANFLAEKIFTKLGAEYIGKWTHV